MEDQRAAPRPDAGAADGGDHRIRHITALDGVRGLAVAAVLLYHGDALPGGFLGVDAFFVLSGFLITSLLLAEAGASHRIRLREFWVRRARRLLPALFLMLLGITLYAPLLASPSDLHRIRGDAISTLLYFANWHSIAANHGYWSLFQSPSPLEHTWSLAIEEQFYLVWPLVVLGVVALTRRFSRRRVGAGTAAGMLAVSVGLGVASTAWMWVSYRAGTDPSRLYFGTDTRAGSILVGAALAAWLVWKGPTRRVERRVALEVAAVVAMVFLAFEWARASGTAAFLYRGGFLACGLAVAAVIAAAAHPRPGVVARVLAVRPLVLLGVISYGVYLWHWPIYVAMTERSTGLSGATLLLTRIAVTLAVATASFVLVERPIRTGHYPLRRLAIGVPVAAAVCAVAIVASTAGGTATPAIAASPPRHLHGVVLARDVGTRLLVAGDSVGGNLATATEQVAPQYQMSVYDATSPGCLLGIDTARTLIHDQAAPLTNVHRCEPLINAGLASFTPTKVLLVYGNEAAFSDVSLNGQWVGPCDRAYQSWYEREVVSLAATFNLHGAAVYLTNVSPLGSDWPPSDSAQRVGCLDAMDLQISRTAPNVTLIDLAEFVCPGGACRQTYQSDPFRTDGLHFSNPAARYVALWVLGQVQGRAPATTPSAVAAASPRR
jgi:peptidoglycan/LPS O-acetylase OafA/YrhL